MFLLWLCKQSLELPLATDSQSAAGTTVSDDDERHVIQQLQPVSTYHGDGDDDGDDVSDDDVNNDASYD